MKRCGGGDEICVSDGFNVCGRSGYDGGGCGDDEGGSDGSSGCDGGGCDGGGCGSSGGEEGGSGGSSGCDGVCGCCCFGADNSNVIIITDFDSLSFFLPSIGSFCVFVMHTLIIHNPNNTNNKISK